MVHCKLAFEQSVLFIAKNILKVNFLGSLMAYIEDGSRSWHQSTSCSWMCQNSKPQRLHWTMSDGKSSCAACYDHLYSEFCESCGLVIMDGE